MAEAVMQPCNFVARRKKLDILDEDTILGFRFSKQCLDNRTSRDPFFFFEKCFLTLLLKNRIEGIELQNRNYRFEVQLTYKK